MTIALRSFFGHIKKRHEDLVDFEGDICVKAISRTRYLKLHTGELQRQLSQIKHFDNGSVANLAFLRLQSLYDCEKKARKQQNGHILAKTTQIKNIRAFFLLLH